MAVMAATRTVRAQAAEVAQARTSILNGLTSLATAVAIFGVALIPLLTPLLLHPLLDASSSAAWLHLGPQEVHDLSDRTVSELVFGPGSFAFSGPNGAAFFDAAEASHLRDARTLLILFEGLTIVCLAWITWSVTRRRARFAVTRGAKGVAIGVVIVGIVGFFAFEPAFTLFHEIFFPGGNWSFDPYTSHMVQLYPYDFWQLTAATLGVLALATAAIVWAVTRRKADEAAWSGASGTPR